MVALAFQAGTLNTSLACTAADIIAKDKSVIAGRTMDWAYEMEWTPTSLPKGTAGTLSAPSAPNLPTTTVATKYALVGVSPGGDPRQRFA
jgi:choloylglycine hydrolase